MSKTYLCSVGTSCAKKVRGYSPLWVEQNGGVEKAAEAVAATFLDLDFGLENCYELSAELHSLLRLQVSREDLVVFLCSETPDGVCAGSALQLYLEKHLAGVRVKVERLEGLQTNDAVKFRRQGVVSYLRVAGSYVDRYGAQQCVINPTGGFKALVPYAAIFGMVRGVRSHYIFERSASLLELPLLPLDFPAGMLESLNKVCGEIYEKSAVSMERFRQLAGHLEREVFEALFEQIGGEVTLSGIGILLHESFNQRQVLVPYVSMVAWPELEALNRSQTCRPYEFLDRVARNLERRKTAEHGNAGNGFVWLKPGDTSDRYLVTYEGHRMLVWRAVNHAVYDKLSSNPALGEAMARERASKHSPFSRMDFV